MCLLLKLVLHEFADLRKIFICHGLDRIGTSKLDIVCRVFLNNKKYSEPVFKWHIVETKV